MKSGIYKITNPSGKIYIGQSVNIESRLKKYKTYYNSRKQIALHNSFLKHGYDNHKFEIIEKCFVELLNERERFWQDWYNVIKKGLNCKLTSTKSKTGKLSKDTLLKISKALKGRVISKEQRIKLSVAGMGRKNSKKAIDKLIEYNKTRVFSEQTKHKIGINNPTNNVILDFNTGVFYYSIADLSRNLKANPSTLFDRLTGRRKMKNNTQYKIV
jgi:group I intron endonuclease